MCIAFQGFGLTKTATDGLNKAQEKVYYCTALGASKNDATVKVSVTGKTGHASLQSDAKFTFYRILSINFIFRRNLKLLQWKRQ